jgi:hypothetical protein
MIFYLFFDHLYGFRQSNFWRSEQSQSVFHHVFFCHNILRRLIMGWGNNIENINIDDRKWLTSTTFSTPRNINIEKIRRRSSSFFFLAWAHIDVNHHRNQNWKKNREECWMSLHIKALYIYIKRRYLKVNNVECHFKYWLKTNT